MSLRTISALRCLIIAAVGGSAGLSASASAQATDLLLSEYVEGSSNNKAIEIYNGTSAPINLTGYSIEMYFNAGLTPSLTHALSGTIAAGDVYVLTNPAAALAGITAASDGTTSSSAWYNGNDSVVLKKGAAIIDSLGQIGSNPATEWGTGLESTADNTLRRRSSVCTGDTNPNDSFTPAIEWEGFAIDTVFGLGSHVAVCGDTPPSVSSSSPANGGTLDASGNITLTFSEAVSTSGSWFSLSCNGSGVSASGSGTGATRTIDPASNLAAGASCTLTVLSGQVSDLDGTTQTMAADYVLSFTVGSGSGCGSAGTTVISAIQGNGLSSPLEGMTVEIQGVVVGDFQGGDGLSGFNVQEDLTDEDADPATSEGIFVFDGAMPSVNVQIGDIVRVRGQVSEFFTLTEITPTLVTVCSSGNPVQAPAPITLPVASPTAWERWEGMRVSVTGPSGAPLVVTETFNNGRFGEVVLASSRHFIPTNQETPGAGAQAIAELNLRDQIQLDDGRSLENPSTPVPIPYVGANGTLRLGDTLTLSNLPQGQRVLSGVLNYAFGAYEINPTVSIVPSSWTSVNPRPAAPNAAGGARLRVVTANVLNYFPTLDTATAAQCTSNGNCCGTNGTLECRGAQTASELARQESKLQALLKELNPDVLAVEEIENPATSGARSSELALQSLVNLMNTPPNAANTYTFVTTGAIGTDAIKVGFIYKPSKVAPVGAHVIINNTVCPNYRDTLNRPTLAQTFREIASGARFTTLAAHWKSKGSSCSSVGDGLDPNGQGECNGTRLAAAQCVQQWIASDLPRSGDPDYILLGDLNAYSRENPVTFLEANGFVEPSSQPVRYDYVFEGEAGALSHAMITTSLRSQVTDIFAWHVNSDEPRAFDYNDFNQPAAFAADQFRAADHDPIVVGVSPTIGVVVPAAESRWLVLLGLGLVGVGLYLGRRAKLARAA